MLKELSIQARNDSFSEAIITLNLPFAFDTLYPPPEHMHELSDRMADLIVQFAKEKGWF